MQSILKRISNSLSKIGLMMALLLLGSATASQAQGLGPGLRYTFAPVGGYLYESDNSALESEFTYGGELGLGFGSYLQVSGEYLFTDGATTNLAEFSELAGLQDRSVDLRRYGGRLRLNLRSEGYIPYLSAGTGILEFDPNSVDKTESIYATVGAGVTFRLAQRYRVSVGGELLSYRYNPVSTFVGQDIGTDVGEQTVYSPSLRASVEFFLGGRSLEEQTALDEAFRDQFGGGLSNIRLTVDPFYGRLEFNDALGFPKDQNLYGVNAGIDLGPYVGLRGFYWRGAPGDEVFDDLGTDTEDIQMYGGELKLRLQPKRSRTIAPYGLIGGGYLDVLSGYDDNIPAGTTAPEDRFFATGGVGLEVPLSSSILLVGDVRSLLMSGLEVDEVSDPSEVYGSLMYSVGVEFNLGGGPDRRRPATTQAPPSETPAPEAAPAEDPAMTEREQALMARIDSLEQALQQQRVLQDSIRAQAAAQPVPSDSIPVQVEMRSEEEVRQERPASNLSDQTIMLPVPEVGEIYVRFGDLPAGAAAQPSGESVGDVVSRLQQGQTPQQQQAQAGLSAEQVQQIVRDAIREQMRQVRADTLGGVLTQQQVERTVQRTLREYVREEGTLDATAQSEIDRLEEQIEALRRQIRRQAVETGETRIIEDQTRVVGDEQPFYRQFLGRPLQSIYPVVSLRGGQGPTQGLVGVRGDYRRRVNSNFRFLPEIALGFGNGATSISVLGNVTYSFLEGTTERNTGLPLEPYAGVGLGFASPEGLDLEFVGNILLGADYITQNGNTFFVEYSTLDLFDLNRFSVGYRVRF